MIVEGIRLMGIGMAAVFAFLGLLVLAMHANRLAAARWWPEPPRPPASEPPRGAQDADGADIAVVLAAVAAMRRR